MLSFKYSIFRKSPTKPARKSLKTSATPEKSQQINDFFKKTPTKDESKDNDPEKPVTKGSSAKKSKKSEEKPTKKKSPAVTKEKSSPAVKKEKSLSPKKTEEGDPDEKEPSSSKQEESATTSSEPEKTLKLQTAGAGQKGSDYNPGKKNYHPIKDAFWKKGEK